ncbi:MAG TPA: CRISPR system precrRNA processing endoribonuclease RAMP protein Cas6 [Pseudomonadota bacterium]|nr:CRISPR system precrRNA processing endoribonuclease RAMP protein Cas6 [Pseudomonadota bacterium]
MLLPFLECSATYEVVKPFRIPAHPGSLWRGVIGRTLRREGCAKLNVCAGSCGLPKECLYSRLFDPVVPNPPPHRFLRGQQEVPPPLLPLVGWSGNARLEKGATVRMGLRCLGRWTEREQHVLGNVLRMIPNALLGRDEGRVELVSVSEPVSDEQAACARDCLAMDRDSFSMEVRLVTPLWMEQEGRLLTELSFSRLFTDVMRRLTVLCSLYGVHDPDDDANFSALRAVASEVRVRKSRLCPLHWERHSLETDERHPLHGVLGEVTLEGPLAPLVPFLRLAEVAHVGKATSFGLGRLQITRFPNAHDRETANGTARWKEIG